MKNIIAIITSIIVIITSIIAFDARYGKADTQKFILTQQQIHKLEHQEDILEKRLWDLERKQNIQYSEEREFEIKAIKSRIEKVTRKIDKELSIK